MPGFSKRGKRVKGAWDDHKNPRKELVKLWVKFLKNKANFPEGGASALERGAPSLADFKQWVGKAQA